MAGKPSKQGEEAFSSLEQLGSDFGQGLKVQDPSRTISWPSFMWSSDFLEATDSGIMPDGAHGKLSSVSLMYPHSLHGPLGHLDPKVLRLLLAQKDLEIQGLRKAAQCRPGKRMAYILHELTDSKPERASWEQITVLQQQIEELTQQLSDQKEQACQEKTELENQLQQARKNQRHLEDEVQTFQRSCLLHLAQSSWAGRVLRSQTGSVEVVTAEALMMDLSDQSLEQSSSEEHHFRLEDVDWNSVAQRYPNLFEDIYSKKRAASGHVLDSPDSPDSHLEKSQRREKNVEWSLLPCSSLSSRSSTTTDGVSTGHSSVPLSIGPDSSPSLQLLTQDQEGGSYGALPTLELRRAKVPVDSSSCSLCAAVVGIGLERQGSLSSSLQDQGGRKVLDSSLKIVKIDKHGKFIRVLNKSLEESVDISGFVLKQLIHQFPVCVYRFPKDTVLAPQHHVTEENSEQIVGEGSGRWQTSHLPVDALALTPGSMLMAASAPGPRTDLMWVPGSKESIPCLRLCYFLASAYDTSKELDRDDHAWSSITQAFRECSSRELCIVWGEGISLARKHVPQTLQRELIHFHTNPGCVTLLLNHKGQVMSEYQAQHSVTEASRSFADLTDVSVDCYPLLEAEREKPQQAPGLRIKSHHQHFRTQKTTKILGPPQDLEGQPESHRGRLLNPISSINIFKNLSQQEAKEVTACRGSLHGTTVPLPSIPELAQLPDIGKKMQEKCIPRANQVLPPRICRKLVDVDCPMVALSVQKTAESRFGLKHLNYLPITKELREPL